MSAFRDLPIAAKFTTAFLTPAGITWWKHGESVAIGCYRNRTVRQLIFNLDIEVREVRR